MRKLGYTRRQTRSAPPTHTKPKLLSNIITRPPDVFTINFGDIYKSAETEKRKQSALCRRRNLEHAQSQAQVYRGEPQSRPNTSASLYMNAYKRDIYTPISAWGSETYISRQSSPVRAAELADLSEEDAESDIDMAHTGSPIAVRVSPVSNTCCEIMGPQICQECRKNRVRRLQRERSDMCFPNVQCADEKLTTTAIVQKYLPGLSYLEIEDKLARGEIARPSVRRQLTRPEFNNDADNKSKTKKVTIMDKKNDKNNKQKALFQKRPSELYFTNIRELNSKIISGSVDRNIGFTANNKRSSSASAPASRKSTTATSLYPVFISPRKVRMGPDTKYKKYYSPPLIALASQQVEPSFFAGSSKGYNLPEKLPKELVFLDKDGNTTTRRLSSALSTASDLTTTDENSEPLADLQENVAEESLEDTIVEETTDNESVEPESGHDDNKTGELGLEMTNDSMNKVNVHKDSESELVNHSMDNGEVLEKASGANLMYNGNRGNSITDEKS